MPFATETVIPVDPSRMGRMSLRSLNGKSLAIRLGETVTDDLVREHPISHIRFDLDGLLTSTGTPTLNANGPLAMLEELEMKRSGANPFFRARGVDLPVLHALMAEQGKLPFVSGWANGTAARFRQSFNWRADVGGGLSLLDASMDSSLDIIARFRAAAAGTGNAAFYSGGSSPTFAVDANAKLKVTPFFVHGANPGEPGGRETAERRYYRNHLDYQTKIIDAERADFPVKLTDRRLYHGITLFTEADGVRVDTILDGLRLLRAGADVMPLDAYKIRADNFDQYGLSAAELTGVYHIPFVREGHWEDLLRIDNTQDMHLELDVNKPGTVNTVYVYEHFFGD